MLGRTTPSNLIQNKEKTPFNIGIPIKLAGFTQDEIKRSNIKKGIDNKCQNLDKVIKEILKWTGGQPFLTQKLCNFISKDIEYISDSKTSEVINKLVRERILNNWEERDEPEHLKTIRDKFIKNQIDPKLLLETYLQVVENGFIQDYGAWEHQELFMSGIVGRSEGKLTIYNSIYEQLFNKQWIEQHLKKIG